MLSWGGFGPGGRPASQSAAWGGLFCATTALAAVLSLAKLSISSTSNDFANNVSLTGGSGALFFFDPSGRAAAMMMDTTLHTLTTTFKTETSQ